MAKMKIDPAICKRCGTCVASCPETIFYQEEKDSLPGLVHHELCISCGQCVALCPTGALTHSDFPDGSIKPVDFDMMPSLDQTMEILKTRRSIRAFKDKSVEKELIEKVIEGARLAPSDHNVQSTEFTVVQDKDVLNEIIKLTARYLGKMIKQFNNPVMRRLLLVVARNEIEGALHLLSDFDRIKNEFKRGKDTILFNAPALLLFHADKSTYRSDVNAILALHNAALVANRIGLGNFFAGYVVSACKRDDSISRLLSLPKNHQIFGALALGYPKYKFTNWIERKHPQIRWI